MLTKQQVTKARDNHEDIIMTISEECDTCGYKVFWQPLIVKIPEWFAMCINCSEKNVDPNKYGKEKWTFEIYVIGKWFMFESKHS